MPSDRNTTEIQESGTWKTGQWGDGRVFVQSDDFTHDALLYVDGDFADAAEKLRYADEVAKRLNAWNVS